MIKFIKQYWIYIFIGFFVIFLYTYNLNKTSRFIWDESRALVDMHRIWEKKLITFVGPISQDNLEMFPSLSYYLYLPATILSDFDPLGPAFMAAIYGFIIWFVFTVFVIRNNGLNNRTALISLFIAVLNPMVVTSRWAWNPNLIIFWFILFLICTYSSNLYILFIGGLFLGTSLYHHYLSLFGAIPALLLLPILFRKDKNIFKKTSSVIFGFIVSMIPFIIFESKNHFFINSASFLESNNKSFLNSTIYDIPQRIAGSITTFTSMVVPNTPLFSVIFIVLLFVIFIKYKTDKIIRYSFFSLLISLFLYSFVAIQYPHYQYPEIAFLILFLFRYVCLEKKNTSTIVILILLVINLFKDIQTIYTYNWYGDIDAVRNVTKLLINEKESSVNVAALKSGDSNTTGQRYRDMALINGKTLDAYDKYSQSKVLYVVTETNDLSSLLKDSAWEISSFRNNVKTDMFSVSSLPMYLFRIEKLK